MDGEVVTEQEVDVRQHRRHQRQRGERHSDPPFEDEREDGGEQQRHAEMSGEMHTSRISTERIKTTVGRFDEPLSGSVGAKSS